MFLEIIEPAQQMFLKASVACRIHVTAKAVQVVTGVKIVYPMVFAFLSIKP